LPSTVLPADEPPFTCESTINSLNFKEEVCRKDLSSVFCAVLLTVDPPPHMLDRTLPTETSCSSHCSNFRRGVLLEVRRITWIIHDGVPVHCSIEGGEYLNTFSLARWIGRNVSPPPLVCLLMQASKMPVTFGDIRRQTSGIIQRGARRRRLCNRVCTRPFELLAV
jgi:hypothetical protein